MSMNIDFYNFSLTDIGMVIVSICMIIVTVWATKTNSKIYYYDYMIRKEMEVLFTFKNMYRDAKHSIDWFFDEILSQHGYNFSVLEENIPIVKREEIVKHYNKINELNTFYNSHQYIFRKYKLETDILLLTCILCLKVSLPTEDVKKVLFGNKWCKDGDFEMYGLPQYQSVNESFNAQAYLLLYPFKFPTKFEDYFSIIRRNEEWTIRKRNEEYVKNMFTELNKHDYTKFKSEVSNRLNGLLFKLEYLCMFPLKKIPNNLNIRQEYFYVNLEK